MLWFDVDFQYDITGAYPNRCKQLLWFDITIYKKSKIKNGLWFDVDFQYDITKK
jgi:hypothetical protein